MEIAFLCRSSQECSEARSLAALGCIHMFFLSTYGYEMLEWCDGLLTVETGLESAVVRSPLWPV